MDASAQPAAAEPVVMFKRKRGPATRAPPAATATASSSTSPSSAAPGPSRASQAVLNASSSDSDSDADSDDEARARSAVVTKKKRSNHNPLVQSTGAVRRNPPRPDAADSEDDIYPASSAPASTTATSLQKIRDDATRHSNWDLDGNPADAGESASNADGLYRGSKGYASYIAARDDGKSSKMRSRGPIRQTTTVRTTSLMDYQPDVCKDYKETGYCGFGDTCKFLHDRSDYLAGWQLDALPNSTARGREDVLLSDPEEEEEVPFACLICRHAFTAPVVTKCGHYFCEACALGRFAKTSKCFACGAQTGGLFNAATKVLERMNKTKAAKQQTKNSWKHLDVD